MKELRHKIVSNPLNKKVLAFLKVDPENPSEYLKRWEEARSPYDEGGCIFFDQYGKEIPDDCKYSFSIHNIMIHSLTGAIFAFHTGRFSIFFRCDFERANLINSDQYRRGYSLDCIDDITELGEDWSFLSVEFEGEETTHFKWAYEKMIRQ